MNSSKPSNKTSVSTDVAIQASRRGHLSVGGFLIALVLLLVSGPFVDQLPGIEAALLTLTLAMGLFAVGAQRKTLMLALMLVLPACAARWAFHFSPERCPAFLYLVPTLAFFILMVVCLLSFILRARRVDSEVLYAGISVYLLLGMLWAIAYILVAQLVPTAFAFSTPPSANNVMHGFTALYFSFITLTTVGYGDITPVSEVARMLAMMEAMTGTLFLGILIARLVSLYSTPENKDN